MNIPSCQHQFDRLGGKCIRCGAFQRELVLGPLDDAPTTEQIVKHASAIVAEARKEQQMNATRCKMRLVSISGGYYASDKGRTVQLVPVTDDGSEENKRFFNATPSGELNLNISAAAVEALGLDQGKIGSAFYVDITPVTG